MNLQEFAALKVGDTVENGLTNSRGDIVETNDSGVRVAWGGNRAQLFFYSVNTNAWFHWRLVEKAHEPQTTPSGA